MQHDVLVVGAGLIGGAAAHYLTKAGAKVLVVDRGEINRQASGRNAGSLHFQLEHRLLNHPTLSVDDVARLVPLSLAAIEDWRTLDDELGFTTDTRMNGGIMVGESPEDASLLERKLEAEQRLGLRVTLLSDRELKSRAPYLGPGVHHGSWCPDEGHANPRLATPAFINSSVRHGAEILSRTAVNRLDRDGKGWRVTLTVEKSSGQRETREISADRVLCASGAWTTPVAALAGLNVPMQPMPLQMTVTDAVAPVLPHLVQHVSQNLSLKQVGAGNYLIGGGWPAIFHDGDPTGSRGPYVRERNVVGNLAIAARVVPAISRRNLIRTWTGVAGVTPDELPLCGEVASGSQFFVAGGGSAFTLGPTLGRLIASVILNGSTSSDLSLFDPNRFSA